MRIDSHFHCWQLNRGDYGWLTPALAVLYRDVSVADWQAQSAPHGVTGGVLVQAAPTEAETAYLLAQAEVNPAVLGVVGWVDWLADDVAVRIAQLATQRQLKGLRPMLQDLSDPQWVLQPGLDGAWRAMVEADLVFDALIKPVHLPHIETLADRYPGLRIVVDHGAKPDIAAAQWQPWADGLASLARKPGVYCKLSGLMTEAGPTFSQDLAGKVRPYAEHLLACFGTQRLVWGSDWPVLALAGSYAQWHGAVSELLQALDPQARAAVMGGNAARLYRLRGAVS